MKLWLATANPALARETAPLGIFSGIVTNPAVVAAEPGDPVALFAELAEIFPVCWYQLEAAHPDVMLREAERMLAAAPGKVRIKVPATRNGFAVIRELRDRGELVMATCVPTRAWMIFAIQAGAGLIAPYGGMLQKRGIASKADEVVGMQEIIERQNYPAEILTGLYDATELAFYAAAGVRNGFIWGKDVEMMLSQPLADEAAAGFKSAFAELSGRY
jgi:transaldolase